MQSLWMLFAAFVFSIMGVCIKLASSTYSSAEIVMYRGGIGVLFMLAVIVYRNDSIRTRYLWQHLWRGILGVTAMWMWFFSISKLPLATGMTLNYTAPIWMAAILFIGGCISGKKRFEWGLVSAVTMSFVGVVLLLRPSIHAEQLHAGIVALASGFLSALAYLQVQKLGHLGEPESRVVFYLSVTGLLYGLMGTLCQGTIQAGNHQIWHSHSAKGIALLLTIGVTATVAQFAMTRAYRLGKTLVTANLHYTGIIFSSVWGILIWSDILGWISWLGIGIILMSGSAATYYNIRESGLSSHKKLPSEIETDPIAS
jgi:S-adenosylmethionine uptake transporter